MRKYVLICVLAVLFSLGVVLGGNYNMMVGNTAEINGNTISLENVGSSGVVRLNINGVSYSVEGTEKHAGFEITVVNYTYDEILVNRKATLNISIYVAPGKVLMVGQSDTTHDKTVTLNNVGSTGSVRVFVIDNSETEICTITGTEICSGIKITVVDFYYDEYLKNRWAKLSFEEECFDSDGENYYEKGYCKTTRPNELYYDFCIDNSKLAEYHCIGEGVSSTCAYLTSGVYCKNGCRDGACLDYNKKISISDLTCNNGKITMKLKNEGGLDITHADLKVLIDNVDVSEEMYFGVIYVGSTFTSFIDKGYTGKHIILAVAPSNSVRQTVYCQGAVTTTTVASSICTDSDGGKDYYTKGTTLIKGSQYATDFCWNYDEGKYGSCEGNEEGCVLVEHSCKDYWDGTYGYGWKEKYKCPNGCKDGACIKETTECRIDEDCPKLVCIKAPCPQYKCLDGKCVLEYSTTTTLPKTDEKMCKEGGGEWKQFGSGCHDECWIVRSKEPVKCTMALSYGCDCGDDKCWNGRSCEDNYPTSSTTIPINRCPNGCLMNDICLPFGNRVKVESTPSYCDIDKTIKPQKEMEDSCMNDYECLSNDCSDSKCVSTYSLLQKIWEFLKNIFSFRS
ncbi:MAG: hypothetical protein COY38_03035 [Candidatus Aenigmarchaeota archaeon CG_4_10_14_0_8_um_filter_37_24]|nr:hypothetical protein [Candidatus Aenigmarchaeota archaeon]OIN87156.1 MAG: hypothetical protein AUJ50_03225 [Candidatus Aenigmarchaeota archaeon CG1_02_38_14]PIY35444.1 MAG: hypothetical protein COZ04_03495 [Candidatus Aenigmarchaeota archaeon CG_4_10_14_3_um_filter_37_21]PIZ34976.1 MAG: hypothetical protein COY38_03035 [Candidatus Aenigmarchaeota archaeon CG_4_10_14_0_8_um_filter_37_24]PJB74829.1 MAG: hypothetical protein CO092_03870 [Candidatus Aenigmarchaeota archaeon CG_4_9_14_3_um_filter